MLGKVLHTPWLIDYEMISISLKKAGAGLAATARDGLLAFSRLQLNSSQTNLQSQYDLALRFELFACDVAYLQSEVDLAAPIGFFDRNLDQAAHALQSINGDPVMNVAWCGCCFSDERTSIACSTTPSRLPHTN